MRVAWLACCALGWTPIAHAQDLSFNDALARASDGPRVEAGRASVRAAQLAIGPAGQLPDPELVLGLENVPLSGVDRYRLDRDEMTMQRIGIMQEMPSGLGARRSMAEAEADRAGADLALAELEARLGAAQAWISLHYVERRAEALQALAEEAVAAAGAARGRLAAGAGTVDETIAAEIEAARLADRLAELAAARVRARGELRRWIGAAADQELAAAAPEFAVDAGQMRERLRRHPALGAYRAEIGAAQAGLAMARAERRPDWSWGLTYGRRDPSFGDMASIEVRVGLPLFQPWRQGPLVDARRADVARAEADTHAAEREYSANLETQLAEYDALSANLERARSVRLPFAVQRAEAAAGAFAAGRASAAELIEARRARLEAELEAIELEERRALVGAQLTLQYGESLP
ncbi:MAG: TolC family protein [Hyphomonadaceae bacterium]|jgi:outer membrane protein TolC|nr:TolC family protein [Hyphomonadaceae bacterium]